MNLKHLPIFIFLHLTLVLFFIWVFDYEQIGDSLRYIDVSNEFFSFHWPLSAEKNCNTAPGYPLFLALLKPFTAHNKFLIASFQALIFVIALYYFLKRFFPEKENNQKNILYTFFFIVICPEIIHLNGNSLSESLCASLLLFIFGAMSRKISRRTDKWILFVSLPLLILSKFEYFFIYFIVLLYLFKHPSGKKFTLQITGIIVILLAINGLKNYKIYGVFNPTSFGSGTVIYGGNNLLGDGSWHIAGKTKGYIPEKHQKTLDSLYTLPPKDCCPAQDALYKQMAKEAWTTNWKNQLAVIPLKFGKLWLLPGSMDFYTGQAEVSGGLQLEILFSSSRWPWYAKYKHALYLFMYWAYLLIALSGIFFKYKKQGLRRIDLLILLSLLAVSAIYSIPFYGLGRFHLPIFGLLLSYSFYVGSKYLPQKNTTDGLDAI